MNPQDQPAPSAEEGDIPFMQRLLDNHFLLLFLGVAIPTVVYIIWVYSTRISNSFILNRFFYNIF